jgi:tRNA G46 methylase TrmB
MNMVFSSFFEDSKGKKKSAAQSALSRSTESGAEGAPNQSARPRHPPPSSVKKKLPPQHDTDPNQQEQKRTRPNFSGGGRRGQHHLPRRAPSAAALDLSRRLRDLSRQKKLEEALALYNITSRTDRDEHHACIVIDCCARCGNIDAAEAVAASLLPDNSGSSRSSSKKSKQCPTDASAAAAAALNNIETLTALLKGYAHVGRMKPAMDLFRSKIVTNPKGNVRALNTFLRGCLWTATATTTTTRTGNDDDVMLVGGVVASEEAWSLYMEQGQQQTHPAKPELDVSSYEYSISLLCQALRTREAEERIATFLTVYGIGIKGKASVMGGDQSSLETLAVVQLGLARAYALLGLDFWRVCQVALNAIKASRALLLPTTATASDSATSAAATKRGPGATGGKRGWKHAESSDNAEVGRTFSNTAYRTHRLAELEMEALALLKTRGKSAKSMSKVEVAKRLQSKLLYFSGGGTTDAQSLSRTEKKVSSTTRNIEHLVSTWHSFGLSQLAKSQTAPTTTLTSGCEVLSRCGLPKDHLLENDGSICLDRLFENAQHPLDIEIGAGFGSWIVQQAQSNPERNYMAVELRADRVFQIFTRATIACDGPLDNVCVVGAECGSFLRARVKKGTVSTIFANHPEPPTQTYGDDRNSLNSIMNGASEPAHMLNSKTIAEMGLCLKKQGKIVIVTDNRFYARMLGATCARSVKENKGLLRSVSKNELSRSSLRHVESFANTIDLYEGRPGADIGHQQKVSDSGEGASYFDRLWLTGAGRHAEKRTRFVVLLQRI